MTAADRVPQPSDAQTGRKLVAPTTRVSVAFPFSHLHIEESGKDLAELAAIVAQLVALVVSRVNHCDLRDS